MSLLTIRPITSQDQLNAVVKVAKDDDHFVLDPTHILQRDGETVGYVALGRTVIVNVHTKTGTVTARDSVHLLSMVEALLADHKVQAYVMPCAEKSPYYEFMDGLGFKSLGPTTMYLKNLQVPVTHQGQPAVTPSELTREAQARNSEAMAARKAATEQKAQSDASETVPFINPQPGKEAVS